MGYYTKFSLGLKTDFAYITTEDFEKLLNEITYELSKYSGYDQTTFEDMLEFPVEIKWYSWKEDMQKVANDFPSFTFKLEGDGESDNDFWIALFKSNKQCIRRNEYDYEGLLEKEAYTKPIIWE